MTSPSIASARIRISDAGRVDDADDVERGVEEASEIKPATLGRECLDGGRAGGWCRFGRLRVTVSG